MSKKKRALNGLTTINNNTAGIDIGGYEHYVAVPVDREGNTVRSFDACTEGLLQMVTWLKENNITSIAMESTGTYWIAVFDILEENDFEVLLTNPKHLKNVTGRKTDVSDCQWIQQLHSFGLLQPAFRPELVIRKLRTIFRQRRLLKAQANKCIQRIHKDLHAMNFKLDSVVGSLCSATAMKIIRAIAEENVTDPFQLAALRDSRCKKSLEEIARALHGNFSDDYIFTVKQHLELFDFYNEKITICDEEINTRIQNMIKDENNDDQGSVDDRSKKISKAAKERLLIDNLKKLLGVDITEINGVSIETALTIVAEIGFDFSKFPTPECFVSWLKLDPNNKISGGKILSNKSRPSVCIAKVALRMAASTLARSNTPLGSFFRRIQYKPGGGFAKAVTATARKIAIYIYKMVTKQEAFKQHDLQEYETNIEKHRLKKLQRSAFSLGLQLVPA